MDGLKKDFPIFKNRPSLVYLDSAATSQKPIQVIKAVTDWYEKYNSNVHRGIYSLAQEATDKYEEARKKAAEFIGAKKAEEIIFTGNASEAINLAAYGWGRKFLKSGDIVVLSEAEHHSNIVPWIKLKEELGIKLFYFSIDKYGDLDWRQMEKLPKRKIKLVALAQASNVLGTINPIGEITNWLKEKKIATKVLIDAAQSVPHIPVNVRELGCDFLAFSGHKMLGPSGIGVLWAKKELLENMDPLLVGSHMISTVTKDKAEWAEIPEKFETGTGRLEAAAGLGAAIDYLNHIGMNKVAKYEQKLTEYLINEINKIKDVEIYGKRHSKDRLGVVSFNIRGIHPHDTGEILNRKQICVRTGHHCAQPLMNVLGVPATVRASLYIYNDKKDIDKLIDGITEVKKIFKK